MSIHEFANQIDQLLAIPPQDFSLEKSNELLARIEENKTLMEELNEGEKDRLEKLIDQLKDRNSSIESQLDESAEKSSGLDGDAENQDQENQDTSVSDLDTEDLESRAEEDSDTTKEASSPMEVEVADKEVIKATSVKAATEDEAEEKPSVEFVIERKTALIESLKEVCDKEYNIASAFEKLKTIQAEWNSYKGIRTPEHSRFRREFNYQLDEFFYTIEIKKDLRQLDQDKNLEQKQHLLEKMEELLEMDSISLIEDLIKTYEHDWADLGPVPFEQSKDINNAYRALTRKVYRKIHGYYEGRNEELRERLKVKIDLCEKVKEINKHSPTKHKTWKTQSEEIMAVQEEWKKIGYSEENETIWEVFRSLCDDFFGRKRNYYKELEADQKKNQEKKEDICSKAEAVMDSQDWKRTSEYLIRLQQDWKKIGTAHPRFENAIWKRFRTACDHFFESKKKYFESIDEVRAENVRKKYSLIEDVRSIETTDKPDETLNKIKEITIEWNSIHELPQKEVFRLQDAFSKAISNKLAELDLGDDKQGDLLYKYKIEGMKQASNSYDLLVKEEKTLIEKMQKLQAEVSQYENNLGFFSKSNNAEVLKKQFEKKVENSKLKVQEIKNQIKIVSKAIGQ